MHSFFVSLPHGDRIRLNACETRVGRNKDNDIVLSDRHVSRKHFIIERKGLTYALRDLGSTNGTFVNGKRASGTVKLKSNDTITIGETGIAFQFRRHFLDIESVTETAASPGVFPALTAGAIILAFILLNVFVNSHSEKIEVASGLKRLAAAYGPSVVPDDPAILAALEKEVEKVRRDPSLPASIARKHSYESSISSMLAINRLSTMFLYIPWVESGYITTAINARSGAGGMWQLMPGTARGYGLHVDRIVDERLDPEKATKAAVAHLKDLVGMFGNDSPLLVLAAYNAGYNAVLNALMRIEDPVTDRDFWYLSVHDLVPAETKRYVLVLLALIIVNSET